MDRLIPAEKCAGCGQCPHLIVVAVHIVAPPVDAWNCKSEQHAGTQGCASPGNFGSPLRILISPPAVTAFGGDRRTMSASLSIGTDAEFCYFIPGPSSECLCCFGSACRRQDAPNRAKKPGKWSSDHLLLGVFPGNCYAATGHRVDFRQKRQQPIRVGGATFSLVRSSIWYCLEGIGKSNKRRLQYFVSANGDASLEHTQDRKRIADAPCGRNSNTGRRVRVLVLAAARWRHFAGGNCFEQRNDVLRVRASFRANIQYGPRLIFEDTSRFEGGSKGSRLLGYTGPFTSPFLRTAQVPLWVLTDPPVTVNVALYHPLLTGQNAT